MIVTGARVVVMEMVITHQIVFMRTNKKDFLKT